MSFCQNEADTSLWGITGNHQVPRLTLDLGSVESTAKLDNWSTLHGTCSTDSANLPRGRACLSSRLHQVVLFPLGLLIYGCYRKGN